MVGNTQSTLRLMGITSGLDTESIIQQMMKVSQLKIDAQNRNKTNLEWKQAALNGIKTDISDLTKTFMTTQGSKAMFGSGAYVATVAETSGKNADAVKISTNLSSPTGSFTINSVESIASGKKSVVENASKSGNGFSTGTQLKDLRLSDGTPEGKAIDFVDGKAEIEINGKKITLKDTDKLGDMMKKVNDSGAGVTMSYDRLSDTFKLEANKTGVGSKLDFSGDALSAFGFGVEGRSTDSEGTKAVAYINNQRVESESNTFDFRGVSVTLNRATTDKDEEIKVNVKRDATAAVDKIKEFVNSYNNLIKKLEGLIKERKTGKEATYKPLTDEEKTGMTEKQIEDWEAIAKKGVLRNDSGLSSLVTSLRGSLFDAIEGTGMKASDIGLSTGNFFGGTGGQIVLDEDKLRSAIESDPEKVMNIFAKVPPSGGGVTKQERYNQGGLLYRMNDLLKGYVDDRQTLSLDGIEKSMKKANEQIEVLQRKMYKEEEALYKKFASMEKAMTSMQSQSSWMSSMLGGG